MTTEQEIVQMARAAWEKLHYNQNYQEDYKVTDVWEYWLKAYQQCSKQLWTDQDMRIAYSVGWEAHKGKDPYQSKEWVEEYKQSKQGQ